MAKIDDSVKKTIPELRFKGFTDEWEERKFKDIIEKLTGGASIKPSDYLEEGIRTIPKGAVNSTGLADLSGSKYISEEFYESNKSSHVSTNNLVTSLRDLVPSAPNMGRIVRIAGEDEDFLMPQGVYKLELFDGMDEEFLIAFSNSDKYRKIISSEKNGSTQVHIRNGEFLNIDIKLPFSEEQKQIGSFFKQLDNSIALHQRKLDLLKEQKKGYLQKMFPKNGAKVPELRFAGFAGDWEERKLGDTLTELKSGLSRMLSNNDIGLPVVRANNINDGQFNIDSDVKYWYVNDPQGANTVNYLIRKNDILINFINSEAKMGTATIVENTPIRDTIYTTNILRARLKKEYDSYYWFALTQINQYKINIKIIIKPVLQQSILKN
ncbi:restriction endonuclease subunit S [Enterococcus italicus]|uniref:restriction endonuclease subunit S n=1 Tax=Enterococcus italicus TaxID=246144 RepID=UPI003F480E80